MENNGETFYKLLLVEDDKNLGKVVKDYLRMNKFEIVLAENGEQGFEMFKEGGFDLCILDVMLPKMDGFSLAKLIRKLDHEVPIIFLTAKALDEDKLEGFQSGADDYVTKPFNIEELVLRIKVFLRRSKAMPSEEPIKYQIGKYEFDYRNLALALNENSRGLTQREADILLFLTQNKGNVIRREDILMKIWQRDDYFAGRSLDVFLSKLRKYLKEDPEVEIQNYHSVGFRLIAP
jgi:DNA-binding response OmpR family regulator